MPLEALAGGFRVAQAALGTRFTAPAQPAPSLPEVFRQVVGALFACLERHQAYCLERTGSQPVPLVGELEPRSAPAAPADPLHMVQSFRNGVRDLAPLLEQILAPDTWREIRALPGVEVLRYPDELWAATVYQAAASHRRGSMHGEHVVMSLVPLYLGRAAAFLLESPGGDTQSVAARLEALEQSFEAAKPALGGWRPDTLEVSHG
jgi:hypothetical protein